MEVQRVVFNAVTKPPCSGQRTHAINEELVDAYLRRAPTIWSASRSRLFSGAIAVVVGRARAVLVAPAHLRARALDRSLKPQEY
jgi:hypothetical protein